MRLIVLSTLTLTFIPFLFAQETSDRWIIHFSHGDYNSLNNLELSSKNIKLIHYRNEDVSILRYISSVRPTKNELEQLFGRQLIVDHIEKDAIGLAAGKSSIVPNDTHYQRQWYLHNDGTGNPQSLPALRGADINILPAWERTQGNREIIVSILDTGIYPELEDLSGRLWRNNLEIPNNGIDDDKNGYIDDIYGWDFVNNDNSPLDDSGHGTALAGIIGARFNNGIGVAGIDQHCRLMIGKVLRNDQSGFLSDWAEGIYYAVNNGADIINLSVVSPQDIRVLSDAIEYAAKNDVIVVASMGNNNNEISNYPAAYPSVVAVGSSDPDDSRSRSFNRTSSGSNFGEHIDILAPGNGIFGISIAGDDQVTVWNGTSMACGIVSGGISLLMGVRPELSTGSLKGTLFTTAKDHIGDPSEDISGWDKYHGFGRLDIGKALDQILNGRLDDPFELILFPNPVDKSAKIRQLLLSNNPVKIVLTDQFGKIYFEKLLEPDSRILDVQIDTEGIKDGNYYLTFQQSGHIIKKRLTVLH